MNKQHELKGFQIVVNLQSVKRSWQIKSDKIIENEKIEKQMLNLQLTLERRVLHLEQENGKGILTLQLTFLRRVNGALKLPS